MKRDRFIRRGSCLSLLAMLPTMFGPTLMMQTVEAQPADDSIGWDLENPPLSEEMFYVAAWGLTYVQDQYIMTMKQEYTGSQLWYVDVHQDPASYDADPNITGLDLNQPGLVTGTFETFAYNFVGDKTETAVDPVDGSINSVTIGIYAIAGTFTGSSGFQTPLYGIATRISHRNSARPGEESSFYLFTPRGFSSNLDVANDWVVQESLSCFGACWACTAATGLCVFACFSPAGVFTGGSTCWVCIVGFSAAWPIGLGEACTTCAACLATTPPIAPPTPRRPPDGRDVPTWGPGGGDTPTWNVPQADIQNLTSP